ncbi:MAG: ABC transporter ATP-binding protein [Burkholderiaceae bacterium]|nr:ABC transporter ATP-binding protein [Burkholderiaceae bacterium]
MPPRLSLRNVSKRYPAVLANDAVSLEVAAGEIHAVLGENGAGKSTLMKIVAGEVRPDTGEIAFDGRGVEIDSPQAARALGIAMVHQHFALFDTLTVAENIALGLPTTTSMADLQRDLGEASARYGLAIDAQRRVHDLSTGERQRVEILRALLARPKLLIMDEPTSVLTPQAVESLFVTLRGLAADGVSVLFISHKLDEIRRLADRCTVMRAGRVVATVDPKRESEASLARLMIGTEPPQIAAHDTPPGPPRLVVDGLRLRGEDGAPLAFTVHAGEIVGVAGISGNGQRALVAALAGEAQAEADALRLDGRPLRGLGPRQRRALGLRYVPEERLRHGAVPELTLAENTLLTGDSLHRHGFIRPAAMRGFARRVIERFDVRCAGPHAVAATLSGGNLQKFIVGREIEGAPRALIVDQPTWGVDVGAAGAIRNALIALRAQGCAILVVSEELDELFEICDRIMVMSRGRLSPAVPARSLSVETIGRWMSGLWDADAAAGAAP